MSASFVVLGHTLLFHYADELQRVAPFRDVLKGGQTAVGDLVFNIAIRIATRLPEIGVNIFFVISGYLITSLLLEEERTRGVVSIKAFYVRRMFRILPAFWVYLLTIFALRTAGVLEAPAGAFVRSAFFMCNIPDACDAWFLAHTWSLSFEEQFYLVWPFAFVALGARRGHGLVALLLALTLASFWFRAATSFALIACGALYAVSARARAWVAVPVAWHGVPVAALLLVAAPFFASAPAILMALDVARPVLTSILFFGSLAGVGPFVSALNSTLAARLGLASYSIYLWQQISTGDPKLFHGGAPPIVIFVAPALASYFLIEKPFIRIGHRLSARILARTPPR
ncbi:MAG: acyltransferase [Hyphomicrobiales bacterium]|nr:acyltransferase [Hyphomicrobiales bacterium]